MELVFGIILLVAAVFLVVAVLLQHGKSYGLSGTISGGAETFFGKTKGQTLDNILSKVTSIVAVCFCALVIVMYMLQPATTNASETVPPSEDTTASESESESASESETPSETESNSETEQESASETDGQ